MISIAAAASRAFSPSTPNASVVSIANNGRQRFPPLLNMYLTILFASSLSKFASRVSSIFFSMGSRHSPKIDGYFLVILSPGIESKARGLGRYLTSFLGVSTLRSCMQNIATSFIAKVYPRREISDKKWNHHRNQQTQLQRPLRRVKRECG